jgi:hypothetical protein
LRLRFIFIIIFILISGFSFARESDTLLNTVLSKPYFYNIVKNGNGHIFTGTSNGVFQLKSDKLSLFNNKTGYIKINKDGNPEIDSSGVSSYASYKYLHLLPYPSEKRIEYHAGNEQQFYIVSGGRLHIFDILPYSITLRNQSIRSISKNFIGGYSGVYYKGNKMDYPTYTDGYIREIGDTAFICYGGLFMMSPKQKKNFLIEPPYSAYIDSVDVGYMDDIFYDEKHQKYFLATKSGVYVTDKNLRSPKKIFDVHSDEPLTLLGAKDNIFIFIVANKLVGYSFTDGRVMVIEKCAESILSGFTLGNRKYYTLSKNTLFQSNTNTFFSKVASFQDAHSMLALNDKEFIIIGNQGLYLFNLESQITTTIITGVEFNRKALYLDNNKLYVGSISGLYTIDVNQIYNLISRNNIKINADNQYFNSLYWKIVLIITFLIFIFIFIKQKHQLRKTEEKVLKVQFEANQVKEKVVNKEMIEDFVRHNLSTASIKSIVEHFNTNNSQIYTILQPEKPGTIIQKLRMEVVMEMRHARIDINQISRVSGFSVSYIRKIKKDQKAN